MKLDGSLKLVSQLLDMPIVDKTDAGAGSSTMSSLAEVRARRAVKALLVGPGAYAGRMPRWLYGLVRRLPAIAWSASRSNDIVDIGAVVQLACPAKSSGSGAAKTGYGAGSRAGGDVMRLSQLRNTRSRRSTASARPGP